MPIVTQCPHCRKKFRAADKVAGKAVKCPGCQKVVRIPAQAATGSAASPPDSSWFIRSEGGEELGPVSKEQLDNLATKGRLGFCKIRRQDWTEWKWADDVYPDLPPAQAKPKPSKSATKPDDADSARLVTCPDCGNTVSLRATQCPHCGCPAAVLKGPDRTAGSPTGAGGVLSAAPKGQSASPTDREVAAPPPPVPDEAREAALDAALDRVKTEGSRSWKRYAIVAGVVVLVLLIATPLAIWWKVSHTVDKVTEQLGVTVPEPPPPIPEPEDPSDELLSPEGKRECIDEAAREMARHIDDLQREYHMPLSAIAQTKESVKMLEALASGDLDAIPDSTNSIPGGSGVVPYESQYDDLFLECRNWVRKNVKRDACTTEDVWQTAKKWAEDKKAAVLAPLRGVVPE